MAYQKKKCDIWPEMAEALDACNISIPARKVAEATILGMIGKWNLSRIETGGIARCTIKGLAQQLGTSERNVRDNIEELKTVTYKTAGGITMTPFEIEPNPEALILHINVPDSFDDDTRPLKPEPVQETLDLDRFDPIGSGFTTGRSIRRPFKNSYVININAKRDQHLFNYTLMFSDDDKEYINKNIEVDGEIGVSGSKETGELFVGRGGNRVVGKSKKSHGHAYKIGVTSIIGEYLMKFDFRTMEFSSEYVTDVDGNPGILLTPTGNTKK